VAGSHAEDLRRCNRVTRDRHTISLATKPSYRTSTFISIALRESTTQRACLWRCSCGAMTYCGAAGVGRGKRKKAPNAVEALCPPQRRGPPFFVLGCFLQGGAVNPSTRKHKRALDKSASAVWRLVAIRRFTNARLHRRTAVAQARRMRNTSAASSIVLGSGYVTRHASTASITDHFTCLTLRRAAVACQRLPADNGAALCSSLSLWRLRCPNHTYGS